MSTSTHREASLSIASEDDGRVCLDIPDAACQAEPRNMAVHVLSLAATKMADGLIDPKLVLSWLLTALGAPAALVGLLVPIREAGALLPQLFIAASIRALPVRKWVWAAGSGVQGLCAVGMGLSAWHLDGAAAGFAILGLLCVLALARSACSVAYKDVLGKTVDRARRGRATGLASSLAAGGVLVFALVLASDLVAKPVLVPLALVLAGALWIAAAMLFSTLGEVPGATEGGGSAFQTARRHLSWLVTHRCLRRFVAVRALLTATALAPPFMVAHAGDVMGGMSYGGLGFLVFASAMAGLLSSYVWGRLADVSSRQVLVASGATGGAALAGTVIAGGVGVIGLPGVLPALLFALMIAYQGVRLGRSTHLVDMATEETRAGYTALSNTVIGLVLLAGGAFSLLAAALGTGAVLAAMAVMCLLAVPAALGLDEVQTG